MNLPKSQWLWNFYRDGITQSFINKFLTCRYQCYLEYCCGLTPKTQPVWFKFGNIGHYVLQHCYLAGTKPTEDKIKLLINEIADKIILEDDLEEKLEADAMNEIIFQMMRLYFTLKGPFDFSPEYHFLHTEKVFKVPFTYVPGKDVWLNGMLDGVIETINDNIRIMDHKFLSRIEEEDIKDYLPHDVQINLYSEATRILFDKLPSKVLYNIIRRPGQRFTKSDTLQTYVQKIVDDILKRPSHYFIRIEYPITGVELHDYQQNVLKPIIREIQEWYDNDCQPRYYNPTALINKYGKCAMFNYITTGSTHGLERRNVVFKELAV